MIERSSPSAGTFAHLCVPDNKEMNPSDHPIGSLSSRAVARLILQTYKSERDQAWLEREKHVYILGIMRPSCAEHNKPYRSDWYESSDGKKSLWCILRVPRTMIDEEAARIVFPNVVTHP
jgi:hypothetical protein